MVEHVGIRGVDTGWLQRYLLELGYDVEEEESADTRPVEGTTFAIKWLSAGLESSDSNDRDRNP